MDAKNFVAASSVVLASVFGAPAYAGCGVDAGAAAIPQNVTIDMVRVTGFDGVNGTVKVSSKDSNDVLVYTQHDNRFFVQKARELRCGFLSPEEVARRQEMAKVFVKSLTEVCAGKSKVTFVSEELYGKDKTYAAFEQEGVNLAKLNLEPERAVAGGAATAMCKAVLTSLTM